MLKIEEIRRPIQKRTKRTLSKDDRYSIKLSKELLDGLKEIKGEYNLPNYSEVIYELYKYYTRNEKINN